MLKSGSLPKVSEPSFMLNQPVVYRLLSNHPLLAKYYPAFDKSYFKIPGVPVKDYEDKYVLITTYPTYSPTLIPDTLFTMNLYEMIKGAGDDSDELIEEIKAFISKTIQTQLGEQINSNPEGSLLHIYSTHAVKPGQCPRLPLNASECPTTDFILIDLIDTQNHPRACAVCKEPASSLCAGCRKVAYCSRECQRADWPKHKAVCKSLGAKGGKRKTSKRRKSAKRRKTRHSSP